MSETDGEERRGFRIRGRVQGVGFRWYTRTTAEDLGVRGSVKNLRDGTVEVHAQAPPGVLDRLEERLRSGPAPARVEAIERSASELPIPERGFRIVR